MVSMWGVWDKKKVWVPYIWPPKYRAGALSTELWGTHGEQGHILCPHLTRILHIVGSAMLRSYCKVKEWKMANFKLGEQMWRRNNQPFTMLITVWLKDIRFTCRLNLVYLIKSLVLFCYIVLLHGMFANCHEWPNNSPKCLFHYFYGSKPGHLIQLTKKVMSDSPRLVDFAIGPVIFVLTSNLLDGQVLLFGEIQITEGL